MFALSGTVQAEHSPYTVFKDQALRAFQPLKGTVIAVEGTSLQSSLGKDSGLRPGMRLTVLKPGKAYVHPITGERVGQAEEPTGTAEAVEADETGSRLELISGEAHAGDIVRLSSAPVPMLFFQSSDVEWGIAEEYFNTLKESGRFILIETAPGEPVDGAVLAEARRLGADAALILTASGPLNRTVLKQRILWADDSTEILSGEVLLSETEVEHSRLGQEYFSPDPNKPTLGFKLPYSATLMARGDLDGDGKEEIVFSSGSTIRAYSMGAILTPALKGIELEGSFFETHIWMQAVDLSGDGADDLLVTASDGRGAHTYIYTYRGGEFQLLWEKDIFARVIDGRVYGQRSRREGGFTGKVFAVDWKSSGPDSFGEALPLPDGTSIYDFALTNLPDGTPAVFTYDSRRHMALYRFDTTGTILWKSETDYGWPDRFMGEKVQTDLDSREPWGVSNRMVRIGSGVVAIKRSKLSDAAPGFGNADARVVALYPTDKGVDVVTLVHELPGGTSDIAVLEQQLLVLANTSSINPLKLIKGRGLFDTKLFIYALRSE
jgi:hypothetical protein